MPRGFKRARVATEEAGFKDNGSYVSLDGHLLLYRKDKAAQRHQIFLHCNPDNIPEDQGEWHHLRNEHNQNRRCDCLSGGVFISKAEHRKQHAQVQFNKLYENPRQEII